MKTIKDYNGDHVFYGDPETDDETRKVKERIQKEAWGVGKIWGYKAEDGYGFMLDFKDLINNMPEGIRGEALLHLLENITGVVANALGMHTLKVLSLLNALAISEAAARNQEEK